MCIRDSYWARLIAIGDLDSIYRRMSVICYEDIGLANPDMGPRVMAAISASELVGLDVYKRQKYYLSVYFLVVLFLYLKFMWLLNW